jgi:hypothetical protein
MFTTHRQSRRELIRDLTMLALLSGIALFASGCGAAKPQVAGCEVSSDAALPMLSPNGSWQLSGGATGFRQSLLSEVELNARFTELAKQTKPLANPELAASAEKLIALAELSRVKPQHVGECDVYLLQRGKTKAQVVVKNEELVSLTLAAPTRKGAWRVYELAGQTSEADATHLLPLPPVAQRSAGRYSEDGQLLMELVSVETSRIELLSAWRHAGWKIRPAGVGGPETFSYLCARGAEVVYAYSADESAELSGLVLTRSVAN